MGLLEDIDSVIQRLRSRLQPPADDALGQLGDRLKELALRRLVSSNHTVMELIIAAHLLSKGYSVEIERVLAPNLVCDIYAVQDGKTLIIEVETGFVPPENSVDPLAYRLARELSKVARYSQYADYFAMAVPPFHILQLPFIVFLPPEERVRWGAEQLKGLIDTYYSRPPVKFEELLSAKLHYVYVVLVDTLELIELTAREYFVTFIERPAILLAKSGWPLGSVPVERQVWRDVNTDPGDQMRRPLSPLAPDSFHHAC